MNTKRGKGKQRTAQSYPWAARVSPSKDGLVHDVLTDLADQGLDNRQILNLLCRAYAGSEAEDYMQVSMPAGMIRRYVEASVREVMTALELVDTPTMREMMSNVSVHSGHVEAMPKHSGDTEDAIQQLIARHADAGDDYEEDIEDNDVW